MIKFTETIPLSLYIHLPWCIKKCPYCDFNSHTQGDTLPESEYVDRLIEEFEAQLPHIWGRRLTSIFIGGGTPSLFSAEALERLLSAINTRLPFANNLEITLEANPGTAEAGRFKRYREIGINRLSIGIQSFNDTHLKTLGRIHGSDEAKAAIGFAEDAGFDNFNLDLMFALPNQTIEEALTDVQTAIDLKPKHISWYQLTIEPNTLFHHNPPPLPSDDESWELQTQGVKLLEGHGYNQYEVSAYCRDENQCKHNRNYWEFGDYLGIGAGAHSKITHVDLQHIIRHWNVKNPKDYLKKEKAFVASQHILTEEDLPLEFMLNALRLKDGVPASLYNERTGLNLESIEELLQKAKHKKLLLTDQDIIKPSALGERFLNDLVTLFL